jgi:hypothetical protein
VFDAHTAETAQDGFSAGRVVGHNQVVGHTQEPEDDGSDDAGENTLAATGARGARLLRCRSRPGPPR